MTCSTCQFWVTEQFANWGCCCRYPPIPVSEPLNISDTSSNCNYSIQGKICSIWPETKLTDWCGEYKLKTGE